MAQESDDTLLEPQVFLPWYKVWFRALTSPSAETFEVLLLDPQASALRAYIWVVLTSLIEFGITLLEGLARGGLRSTSIPIFWTVPQLQGFPLVALMCGLAFTAVFPLLRLMFLAGLTSLAARALGGKGTYSGLAYAYGAFAAPLILVTGLLGILSPQMALARYLGLYVIVLQVIALKAVNRFGWGRAVASTAFALVGLLAVFVAVGAVILYGSGPQISSLFREILQGMGLSIP